MNHPVLFYAHDPMCSYCYAFANTWRSLQQQLPKVLSVQYVVGGLAPDSDKPMDMALQENIQDTWHSIEARFNTVFNYDFWRQNIPRRSTYMACRATLVARSYHKEPEIIAAIQQAYYRQAKNPSDIAVLVDAAKSIGLSADKFEASLRSAQTNESLMAELKMARALKLNSFPSLLLRTENVEKFIEIDYLDATPMLYKIKKHLS